VPVCAACGWDFAAHKHAANPAGVDLFIRPASPPAPGGGGQPPPAAPRDVAPHVDQAPIRPPEEKPRFEPRPPAPSRAPSGPAEFPSNILNPVLNFIKRWEIGVDLLTTPELQKVVEALRRPRVFVATVSALALLFLAVVYPLLPDRAPAMKPIELAPSQPTSDHPMATFADTPKTMIVNVPYAPTPAPVRGGAAPAPPPPPAPPLPELTWSFEGEVFDLLSSRSVSAAKLVFLDESGRVVGQAETDAKGRYRVTLPASTGYAVKIEHPDYTSRYVDDGDPRKPLRRATMRQRGYLMAAAARNAPWIGDPDRPVSRNLAVVPHSPDDP
jgi:hypothetical protein